jgi:MarR family 2-MHQ and catechol resistance regulon transcriptional repressor
MPTRHTGTDEERLALDIFIKMHRAVASIDRSVHAPLREAGLTDIQFGVLDTIVNAGPLPISAIADKNLCSQNSLCSVIDTMERHGHVSRTRSVTDRRVVTVDITAEGRALYEQLWPEHLRRIVTSLSHLDRGELETLNNLLRKAGRPV